MKKVVSKAKKMKTNKVRKANKIKTTSNKQQADYVHGTGHGLTYWKYWSRSWLLTRRFSILPSSDYKRYVCGPSFSWIVYEPIDKDWNFICLPLSSWDLSHFITKSPASKLAFPAEILLNHLLIQFWWSVTFFSYHPFFLKLVDCIHPLLN